MDLCDEIDRAIAGMEWEDVASTLMEAVHDLLGETPGPPSPLPSSPTLSPPPPLVSAGLEINNLQPAEGQGGEFGGCIYPGAAPQMTTDPIMYNDPWRQDNVVQPGYLYTQPGGVSQEQYNNVPELRIGELNQTLRPIGMLNGEILYGIPAPPVSAAPPLNTSNSKKRRCTNQQADLQPHIKKPPNAFMLFMKEQRPHVEAEFKSRGSATVNSVLGQRWKSLTAEQQAIYYDQADIERTLHSQQNPGWSCRDNYGQKRRRVRRRRPEPGVFETPHTQTGVMGPHLLESPASAPVCHSSHHPLVHQVSHDSCLDAKRTASMLPVCPAAPAYVQAESTQPEDIVQHQPMMEQGEVCLDSWLDAIVSSLCPAAPVQAESTQPEDIVQHQPVMEQDEDSLDSWLDAIISPVCPAAPAHVPTESTQPEDIVQHQPVMEQLEPRLVSAEPQLEFQQLDFWTEMSYT